VKPLIVLIFFANALLAQDPFFAINADGSLIHFRSDLLLKSNPAGLSSPRAYRYQAGEPLLLRVPQPDHQVLRPFVSSDGKTFGTYEEAPCPGRCGLPFPRSALRLIRNGIEISQGNGTLRASRNGRFVLDAGFPNLHPGPRLFDLESGESWPMDKLFPLSTYSALSDDGTLVSTGPTFFPGLRFEDGRTILLTPRGQPSRQIYSGDPVTEAAITADGRYVFVLTQTSDTQAQILEIALPSISQRVIWEGKSLPTSPIHLIPDHSGLRLLLSRPGSLDLWDRSTSDWRTILRPDVTLAGALLSDNGNVVVYSLGSNSLYRLTLASNQTEELYPPFPSQLDLAFGSQEPGSMMAYNGPGISPYSQVRVDGVDFPVLGVGADSIRFQVPWDFVLAGPAAGGLQITQPDSPFLLAKPFALNPEIFPDLVRFYDARQRSSRNLAALQQDFSAYISKENPAQAGSTIHMYVTGLGPLDRPLKTLEPGPSDPPARPLSAIRCTLSNEAATPATRELDLPFIAYAAGLVGVYQADVTIPADWPAGKQSIYCRNAQDEPWRARTWADLWTSR
jgi:uncharacterized protein (TIGR03437 family)